MGVWGKSEGGLAGDDGTKKTPYIHPAFIMKIFCLDKNPIFGVALLFSSFFLFFSFLNVEK